MVSSSEAKKKERKRKERIAFVIFVIPALAFVLFATDIPFIMNLYYSFYDWNGIGSKITFVGLKNFRKIFTHDALFWKSAVFTLQYTIVYVVIVNIVSLVVAFMLSKENKPSEIGRAFYYVPFIISLTAISLIWKFLLGPSFDSLYQLTGWAIFNWSWLGVPSLAFVVIIVMTVWQNVGFYMINYIAGIVTVPSELMEAARIDGAGKWQSFHKVMLPLMMPAVSICVLTSMTFGFKLFDVIMVFTKGGPANSTISVAYNIYKEAFVSNKYGLATAKSLIFVTFILIITFIQFKVTKKREVEL